MPKTSSARSKPTSVAMKAMKAMKAPVKGQRAQPLKTFRKPQATMKAMKAMIVRQLAFRDGTAHDDVDALVQAARKSEDSKEGMSARLEKRKPNFSGT